MDCSECKNKKCSSEGKDCTKISQKIIEKYKNDKNILKMGQIASQIEKDHYMKNPRIVEIIQFSKKMSYTHLGIAFCIGMEDEAETLAKILKKYFKVSSVCCKVCGIEKEELGFAKMKEKKYESMCNPVGQAEILNEVGTDLNLIVGLCIGHDILFTQNCKAPVSTFIVKDRVLGHNPAVSLYSKYYKQLFEIA